MAKAKQAQKETRKETKSSGKTVTIKLVRSPIGFKFNQALVVQSIGLRRLNHSVTLADTPETRGMIFKVRHLVEVAE